MKRERCKHGRPHDDFAQPWSAGLGFVYDEEIKFATEHRCLYCGATVSNVGASPVAER